MCAGVVLSGNRAVADGSTVAQEPHSSGRLRPSLSVWTLAQLADRTKFPDWQGPGWAGFGRVQSYSRSAQGSPASWKPSLSATNSLVPSVRTPTKTTRARAVDLCEVTVKKAARSACHCWSDG
ncbi:hypothetical protein HNR72_000744 [Streptomyces collinus]|uniref:Uncharacterized protein n=1 Tax=Streptomyces collinus TaxID=42684 RepID=A0AA89PUL1_STRCU|nr:hypothetical protein [Streptomyces collinus]